MIHSFLKYNTKLQKKNHQWLSARVILAAKNNDVNAIGSNIQNEISGEAIIYKSVDIKTNEHEVVNYRTEFLNSLGLPAMQQHVLILTINVPILFSYHGFAVVPGVQ